MKTLLFINYINNSLLFDSIFLHNKYYNKYFNVLLLWILKSFWFDKYLYTKKYLKVYSKTNLGPIQFRDLK